MFLLRKLSIQKRLFSTAPNSISIGIIHLTFISSYKRNSTGVSSTYTLFYVTPGLTIDKNWIYILGFYPYIMIIGWRCHISRFPISIIWRETSLPEQMTVIVKLPLKMDCEIKFDLAQFQVTCITSKETKYNASWWEYVRQSILV